VQRIIIRLAKAAPQPALVESGQRYEIDELRTFCTNRKNELWVIYAINRTTKRVVDFTYDIKFVRSWLKTEITL
jgi:hypothetical protein